MLFSTVSSSLQGYPYQNGVGLGIGAQISPPSLASLHQPTPPRANSVNEGPASRRGEGEGRPEEQRGGSEASRVTGAVRHRGGGLNLPRRRPSLKDVG